MRTNIVLDDDLVNEAFKFTQVKTKRELVDLAMREFVESHKRLDLMDLYSKNGIREDYDYKKLRTGDGE